MAQKKNTGLYVVIIVLSLLVIGAGVGAFFFGKGIGYNEGKTAAEANYDQKRQEGYDDGYNKGYETGHSEGWSQGYNDPHCVYHPGGSDCKLK